MNEEEYESYFDGDLKRDDFLESESDARKNQTDDHYDEFGFVDPFSFRKDKD